MKYQKRKFYLFTKLNQYYEFEIDNSNRILDFLNIGKHDPYNHKNYVKDFLSLENVIFSEVIFLNGVMKDIKRVKYNNLFLRKNNIILGLDTYSNNFVKVDTYRQRNSIPSYVNFEVEDFSLEGKVYNLQRKFNINTEPFLGIVNPKFISDSLNSVLSKINFSNFCVINKDKVKSFRIINNED